MNNSLLVIDAYISNLERAFICERLIGQIKKVRPDQQILLLNKSGNSFGLESKVHYYYNHGHSFMVGYPPQSLLDSKEYSRPYVYFETGQCILENWMPLTNVTDHVANIYNSYIISSRFSNLLGFEKFVRIEFDINFNLDDLDVIFNRVDLFKESLMFGVRKEGLWMGPNQYLIDVHVSGFSNKIFETFDLVSNDEEYWDVCRRAGYFGKWIEYLIPAIYNKTKDLEHRYLDPSTTIQIRKEFPKTEFDVVNSPGEWKNKWYEIPKLSKIVIQETDKVVENQLGVFFYNSDFESIDVETKIFDRDNNLIFEKQVELKQHVWFYQTLDFDGYVRMESKYVDDTGKEHFYEKEVDENFTQLNCRMLIK